MPRPSPLAPAGAPRTGASSAESESSLRFGIRNLVLLIAGLAAAIVGFVLLAGGSTVAAPLLIVLGYAVLIPLAIFL